MSSPTARSLKWLRDRAFLCTKVEQRLPIPGKFVTRDAFGFGDLLCCEKTAGIALVQTTSRGNLNARVQKTLALPALLLWLESGGKVWLHGWGKQGPRGKRKTWQLANREIILLDGKLKVL